MRALQNQHQRSALFICGMSRSGTTWLAKSLNTHPELVCWGETLYWGRAYVEPSNPAGYDRHEADQVAQRLRRGAYNLMREEHNGYRQLNPQQDDARIAELGRELDCPVTPAELFTEAAMRLAAAEGKSQAVEKTPHHVNYIDRIVGALPRARFVILLRNPYSFTLSYKHQGDRKPQHVQNILGNMYHPLITALVWRGYVRAAHRAMAKYPDQTQLVRFEDMVKQPMETLQRVCTFFGVDASQVRAIERDNSSFPSGKREELGPEDVFWINAAAGKEMQAMGVERRQVDPASAMAVMRSVVELPSCGFAAAAKLASHTQKPWTHVKRILTG